MNIGEKTETQTKGKTLNYREQTWSPEQRWDKQVMGIKEGTCDEHWVLYGSVESLYRTLQTIITLYVNWNLNKNLNKSPVLIIPHFKYKSQEKNV